jgi:DNA-binding NtrC family response regulator
VDDDCLIADATAALLRSRGYAVQTAASLRDAAIQQPANFDCVVVDHQLPDGSGLELASQLVEARTRVVLISANPQAEAAIATLRLGISSFLSKPLDLNSLVGALALEQQPSQKRLPPAAELLPTMRAQHDFFRALARSRCPILITGETGTGKGQLTRTIHGLNANPGPFVAVNCAAIPASLAESELFGVERGAFTGAESRPGLLELADKGTLMLDEIGELAMATQAKLLSFLDDGSLRRLGGTVWKKVAVRIIAATNQSLEEAARNGRFRTDLLHRLQVAHIELSPLRERGDDIAPLALAIIERLSSRDEERYALAAGEIERLRAHEWPGNIRELANAIERSTLSCPASALRPSDYLRAASFEPAALVEALDDMALDSVERRHIMRVLAMANGNRTIAASILKIGVATLRRKLSDWSIA